MVEKTQYGSEHVPLEIRQINTDRQVVITWDQGETFTYAMEYLRVACPCADCRGHHPSQAKLIDGKREVTIAAILPVGNYAIKIAFDDGHDTGVYSWSTLYELGAKRDFYWAEYLADLEAHGKNREVCSLPVKMGCASGSCGH